MLETAKHLLLPRFSNNQKARLLHAEIILIIALAITVMQAAIYFGSRSQIAILGYAANISIEDVVNLTNAKRAENGIGQVTLNQDLNAAAYLKGLDMLEDDYWAHVAPDGTEPWDFFADVGYEYRYAGENLARDFSNAPDAVEAWMASPSHRENLLSNKYQEIGIGIVEGDMNGQDTTIIVQLFGTKSTPQLAAVPEAAAEETAKAEPEVASDTTEEIELIAEKPIQVPVADAQEITEQPVVVETPKVSPFVTTQSISLFVMMLLTIVLVIDIIEVERRNISRIGGRKFAHLAYLITIIAILVISKAGEIL